MAAPIVPDDMAAGTQSLAWPHGAWEILEWTPRPGDLLYGWVERLWHSRGRRGSSRYRVLPHGMVEIIGLRDGRFRIDCSTGTTAVPGKWSMQFGTQGEPLSVEMLGSGYEVLGARVHPALGSRIFGEPLEGLDPVADLPPSVIAQESFARFEERLDGDRSPAAQLRLLRHWLHLQVKSWRAALSSHPEAIVASQHILRSHGTIRIADLTERLGTTKHRLLGQFKRDIGVTPKRFARVHRFRCTVRGLGSGLTQLSRLAFMCGYSDQPHMNNEFKDMSGLTPLEFGRSLRRFRAPSFRLMESPFRQEVGGEVSNAEDYGNEPEKPPPER